MKMEAEFELDERMTDETKAMVTSFLKIMKPADAITLDIPTSRLIRIQNEIRANESIQFHNIVDREFIVKNKDDNHEIAVAVYMPDNCKADSPITIFIHGGGWTFYDVKSYACMVKSLATSTATVWLSIEYRLCPEFKFPIGLNDCRYVLDYVLNNKAEFSTDKAKVGLSGDSSGGHYAALLANEYFKILDYQFLIYPGLNLCGNYDSESELSKDCYLLVPELIDFFKKCLLDEKHEALINTEILSPYLKKSFENMPKTLLIVAELDPCVDQSKKYHEKLRQFNVESELRIIKGVHHGFFSYPAPMKKAFEEAQGYVVDFFSKI